MPIAYLDVPEGIEIEEKKICKPFASNARAQLDASSSLIRPATSLIANFRNVFGRRFMTRAKATSVFWWSRRKDPTSASAPTCGSGPIRT
jgi:hypothetical protein